MLNSLFTWWGLMAVLIHVFINVQSSDAAFENLRLSGARVVRQLDSRAKLLDGAAGLTALAGSVDLVTGLPIRNRQSQHGFRSKRSELGFEIDEAMVLEVAATDESGCGARLLCELHQEEPNQLNGTISRRLVQIFDGQQAPNFEQLRTEPKAAFQYAAFVGSKSVKNLKICAQVFNHCPFSAKIILEVLNIKSAGFAGGETEGLATENN